MGNDYSSSQTPSQAGWLPVLCCQVTDDQKLYFMTDDHVIWDTQLGKNTVNSVGHDKGTPSILILFM